VRLRNGLPNVKVTGNMFFEIGSCRKDLFMWHYLVDDIRSLEPGTSGVAGSDAQKDCLHAAGHAEITIPYPASEPLPLS
jgi:hypothetical protein